MHHSVFSLEASLCLYRGEELFLGAQQIRLLRQVLVDGSIHAAANNLKMSYQHAWHMLDKLNRLSPVPVIVRQKGGKDGGGCSLSPYGLKLLDMYLKKEKEVLQLLKRSDSELDSCFF